jgi:acyl-CoA thioesterase-1
MTNYSFGCILTIMFKKILIVIAVVVALLVVAEIIGLLKLKASLTGYATYWNEQNKTASGTFTYVALGDSTAQGIGASKASNSYAGQLADRIAKQTGKKVKFINLSVTGAKIGDALAKQIPELAGYKPDLVTIEIGANDLSHYDARKFQTEFNTIAGLLPANTYVSDMPYFGGRIKANDKALAASEYIYKAVKANSQHQVYLQKVTRERDSLRVYGADYFHPSDTGYRNWADAFWTEIKPNL